MADDDGQEKTEEPTDDRKEEFRKRGDIAHSKELTTVLVLTSATFFLAISASHMIEDFRKFSTHWWETSSSITITEDKIIGLLSLAMYQFIKMITPLFLVVNAMAICSTFFQTRFNFAASRLKPDFSRMNPLKGLARMVSGQAAFELGKGIVKMIAVGTVAGVILISEKNKVPNLIHFPLLVTWSYWGEITRSLFMGVSSILLLMAIIDYIFNSFQLQKKMRMTHQEIKEEYKKKELDPIIKQRLRRMQRDLSQRKTLEETKKASVIITNPTHYAIALLYTPGMKVPKVLAKGVDFLALEMRKIAKEEDILIFENKPLARTLYKNLEVGQEIPQNLYTAVSEVIRYLFKVKGQNYGKS
ncbi:MAG: flagellar biosynthesis protein FlhB [Oligoflexales bacterium]